MSYLKIISIVLRLFIGGLMLYGGISKFTSSQPAPTFMIEQIEAKGTTDLKANIDVLKIRNYVFGMKQTGYFWQLLGIVEILCGVLFLSQVFSFLAAVICMPVSLNIFLFHLFLEPSELFELAEMALLLAVNIFFIAKEYPNWKHLIKNQI